MKNLTDLADIPPIQVWDGIRARRVQGEQVTLAIVELDPGAVAPEHRHPNEQNGMVVSGTMTFRIADEERELGPGGTWRILAGMPHSARAGAEGAVVIDVFSPIRADWDALPTLDLESPRWPPG